VVGELPLLLFLRSLNGECRFEDGERGDALGLVFELCALEGRVSFRAG
jgi:hypothetical protein